MLDRLTYTRRRVTRPAHEGRARVAVVGRVVSRPVRRTWLPSAWVPEGAGDPRFAQAIIGGSSPCSESLSTNRPVREPTSKLRSTSSSTTRPWLVKGSSPCMPTLIRDEYDRQAGTICLTPSEAMFPRWSSSDDRGRDGATKNLAVLPTSRHWH